VTAALAIAADGDVVVGIDSCSTWPGGMTVDNAEKGIAEFSFDGHPPLVVVCAGSSMIADEMANVWVPPVPASAEPIAFLRACSASLRAFFSEEPRWTMGKEEDGRSIAGHFAAGWRGVAVEISSDFGVLRPRSGEVAIGSGRDFVFGALAATRGRPAEERVRVALEAAAEYQQDVAGPFAIRWAGR